MQIDWLFAALLICISFIAALGAMLLVSFRVNPKIEDAVGKGTVFTSASDDAIFLFDDEALIDATDAGRALISGHAEKGGSWPTVISFLSQHFSGLEQALASLADAGQIRLEGHGAKPLALLAEWRNGLIRLTVSDPLAEGSQQQLDRLSFRAMENEIETLRATTEHLPIMIWRQTPERAVVWANRSYIECLQETGSTETSSSGLSWPLPLLFDAADLPIPDAQPVRLRLATGAEEKAGWFECTSYLLGSDLLFAATPIDGLVTTETKLKQSFQTLTRTFADLPVGLAIFDRERKLAVFNPALTDLTTLDVIFLSARPTLLAFLDGLRENQRMPEPKDYRSWRQQMAALEAAAANGQYIETWTLPSGQTFRVIGRPHPDGAVALMFEDISAEISLTRRFRAQIEIGQSVLDSLPEAISVFSHSGEMEYSNSAFSTLWGADAARPDTGILDALQHWQTRALPAPVWSEIAAAMTQADGRREWRGEAQMNDGLMLSCRIVPLPRGATLVGFTPCTQAPRRNARMVIRYRPRKPETELAETLQARLDHTA